MTNKDLESRISTETHVDASIVRLVLLGFYKVCGSHFEDENGEMPDTLGVIEVSNDKICDYSAENAVIVERISELSGLSEDVVRAVFNAFIEAFVSMLKKNSLVSIYPLGEFEVSIHKGHPTNLPKEKGEIKDYKVVKFKPGKKLKKSIRV